MNPNQINISFDINDMIDHMYSCGVVAEKTFY